jgi:hypothetical protein
MTTRPLSAIEWIIVHHTASADKWSTHDTLAEHQAATNLGYHATIDDDAVFQSKAAGHDGKWTWKMQAPLTQKVNGAAGCNYAGAHVAIDGNSDKMLTEDEKTCLVQVVAGWCKQLGWTKADVLGAKTKPSRIQGHRFVGLHISATKYGTACPGEALIDFLPELRRRVAAYLPN